MAMEWDLRIAADDAKLGFVFNRRGVLPDGDLLWLLPRLVGLGPAMDLLLTGRLFLGAEAAEIGLVTSAVPRQSVVSTALALAEDLATNTAPATVALTKRLLYSFLEQSDRSGAARRQVDVFNWSSRQPDAREGIAAFLEKRPPQWRSPKSHPHPDPA